LRNKVSDKHGKKAFSTLGKCNFWRLTLDDWSKICVAIFYQSITLKTPRAKNDALQASIHAASRGTLRKMSQFRRF